jgi:hypothetical protein
MFTAVAPAVSIGSACLTKLPFCVAEVDIAVDDGSSAMDEATDYGSNFLTDEASAIPAGFNSNLSQNASHTSTVGDTEPIKRPSRGANLLMLASISPIPPTPQFFTQACYSPRRILLSAREKRPKIRLTVCREVSGRSGLAYASTRRFWTVGGSRI